MADDDNVQEYSKGTAFVKKKVKPKQKMKLGMLKPKNTAVSGRNSGRGDSGGMNGDSK